MTFIKEQECLLWDRHWAWVHAACRFWFQTVANPTRSVSQSAVTCSNIFSLLAQCKRRLFKAGYVVQPAHMTQYERVRAAELLELTPTDSQMSQTVYYEL